MLEVEGDEDVFLHVLRVRFAGNLFDHVLEEAVPEIGVLVPLAGFRYEDAVAADCLLHRRSREVFILKEELVVQRQPCLVRSDQAHGSIRDITHVAG